MFCSDLPVETEFLLRDQQGYSLECKLNLDFNI